MFSGDRLSALSLGSPSAPTGLPTTGNRSLLGTAMEPTLLRPKNWATFQHYKDRSPPWIKLHRAMLDDYDFSCLPLASKALAPLLWLLAAESMDGHFTGEPDRIAHRLRWDVKDVMSGLTPLIDKGFFELASGLLADCLHTAIPETEGETEKRRVTVRTTSARFPDFWDAYPNKKGKQDAEKRWRKENLDQRADEIIEHVQVMLAKDDGWQRGFVPMGSTYLNQARWQDVPKSAPSALNGHRVEPKVEIKTVAQALAPSETKEERDRAYRENMKRLGVQL